MKSSRCEASESLNWRSISPGYFPAYVFRLAAVRREILRLDVRNVQESILLQSKVDKRRLDARLNVGDASLVYIADV